MRFDLLRMWLTGFSLFISIVPQHSAFAETLHEHTTLAEQAIDVGDWETARVHFEQAETMLPYPSPLLDYNLGTVYAHTQAYGPAVFHLLRAQQHTATINYENLSEQQLPHAITQNLSVLRTHINEQALSQKLQFSQDALPMRGFMHLLGHDGWAIASILCTLFAGIINLAMQRRGNSVRQRFKHLMVLIPLLCAILFGGSFSLARLYLDNATIAITLEEAAVRHSPGAHNDVTFKLAPGSTLEVLETRGNWIHLRSDQGLEGWIDQSQIAVLSTSS